MIQDRLYKPDTQPPTSVLGQHEHVGEVGEGSVIGDHPREPDLVIVEPVDAERQRMPNRPLDDRSWHSGRPVRRSQEIVHEIEIEATPIGGNLISVSSTNAIPRTVRAHG